MPSALNGRILHRFHFQPLEKDRRRNSRSSDINTSATTGTKSMASSEYYSTVCGFIFIPDDNLFSHKEYLLSLPKRLLKPSCNAVRLGLKVKIEKYTEVKFFQNTAYFQSDDEKRPSSSSSSSLSTLYSIIEVDKLEICPTEFPVKVDHTGKYVASSLNDRDAAMKKLWTLTQFWRKEQLDFKKMKNSRPKFSLLATVGAVSPIVILDSSNPFALVEVCDSHNPHVTSVVVLYGNQALLNQVAIQPFDTLIFYDVVYKPWVVQTLLQSEDMDGSTASKIIWQSLGCIPSHVFVATGSHCVSWNHKDIMTFRRRSYVGNSCNAFRRQSQSELLGNRMATKFNSNLLATSVSGKIVHVEMISVHSACQTSTVIHYLDIIILNQSNSRPNNKNDDIVVNDELPSIQCSCTRCRLYLSYFPMPLALQCSLRRDGIVEAHNVLLICFHKNTCFHFGGQNKIKASYGANLRSTLNVVKHSKDFIVSSTAKNQFLVMKGIHETDSSAKDDTIAQKKSLLAHQLKDLGKTSVKNCPMDYGSHQKKCYSIGLPHAFTTFTFRRIARTYLQEIHFDFVKDWAHRNFQNSFHTIIENNSSTKDVPITWIVYGLICRDRDNWNAKKAFNCDFDTCKSPINRFSVEIKQPASIRNPYAEFFGNVSSFVKVDGINKQYHSSYLSVENEGKLPPCSSELLDLNRIRIASQSYFEKHMSKYLSSLKTSHNIESFHQVRKGFHSCVRVSLGKLYEKNGKEKCVNKKDQDDFENNVNGYPSFVGGFVIEVHTHNSSVASIKDGYCQIPISFENRIHGASIDDFIIGQFDSVMISSICLGNFPRASSSHHKDNISPNSNFEFVSKSLTLPALNSRKNNVMGNCTLVTINGSLFITAIQIHCREYRLHKLNKSFTMKEEEVGLDDVTLTVERCLTTKSLLFKSLKPVTVIGMLTRCRFDSKRNADGSYQCCSLTISSLRRDKHESPESDNSCLQAFQLLVVVKQNAARMAKFVEIVDQLWPGTNLIESQLILGLSFWIVGHSGRTCAMTFGGSEDIVPGSLCTTSTVKVAFPSSSLQLNELGYMRSICSHCCLDTCFETGSLTKEECRSPKIHVFDFVGSTKVVSGMLHQRPSRRNIFRYKSPLYHSIGELLTKPSNAIPLFTLSELYKLFFQAIRAPNASHRIMNPSLVRRITRARFFTVSVCQIQCYCTRCFCSLVSPSSNTSDTARTRKRKRGSSFREVSFWDLRGPKEHVMSIHSISGAKSMSRDNLTVKVPEHIRLSMLRCPKNHCPERMFGVKWECSGILDDGTGQATVYADGDAALTLLRMSAEVIRIIEEGVWSTPDGSIQYIKSAQPPKSLRDQVTDIRGRQSRHGRKKSSMVDTMRLLSTKNRAIYLVERQCRSSGILHHAGDYYVRCKSLVANKNTRNPHVQHATIKSFFEDCGNIKNNNSIIRIGQGASYKMPSLKLMLVDCGICFLDTFRTKV